MHGTVRLIFQCPQVPTPRGTLDIALKKKAELPQGDGLSVGVSQRLSDADSGNLILCMILIKSTVFIGYRIFASCIITVVMRSRGALLNKVGPRLSSQVTRTCAIGPITGSRGYTARVTDASKRTSRWCSTRFHALSGCSTPVERDGHLHFQTFQCHTKYTFTPKRGVPCSLRNCLPPCLVENSFS